MISRVLLAVDDSPDAMAAARLAVTLSSTLGAELLAVHVVPEDVGQHEGPRGVLTYPDGESRDRSASAVLRRVAALAEAHGVRAATELCTGDVEGTLLKMVQTWSADLIVVGRSGRPTSGWGYVGSLTRHVLELADDPVLVVPA